jgi:polysaccharide pyruvyl transferase WcaK-like protein
MKKKVYYCGWQGNGNIGDDAIFEGTKRLLSSFEFTTNPQETTVATVIGGGTLLPIALTSWSNYYVKRSKYNFTIGIGVNDPDFYKMRHRLFDVRWLVGQAGINSKSIINSFKFFGNFIAKIDSFLRQPTKIAQPYLFGKDFKLIKSFRFDRIGVRGPLSQEILRNHGINSEVVGDPALYLKPNRYVYKRKNKIAISIRPNKDLKWSYDKAYLKSLIRVSYKLSDTYEFVILPLSVNDSQVNRWLAKKLPNATYKNFAYKEDLQGLLDEISNCDVMIGERLHANILAAACHVPFVSLEYRPKSRDFAKSVCLEDMNIRLDRVNDAILHNLINRALNQSEVRSKLQTNVKKIRRRLEKYAFQIQAFGGNS